MEVEKQAAKGGFFQLFDWKVKSRKKLFSSKSELPESSNQGKQHFHGSILAGRQQGIDKDYHPNGLGQNDYHYAESAIGDSEYGTKAPGVVARLMGLESLPTSNVNEPSFPPFIDTQSFRDSSYLPAFQTEHDIVIFESVRNKLDGLSRDPFLDSRLQKVHNRPIERFQTEVLPPKSAKPISVTHNRLLSPIKSPGFIPPKNAAYIIEAAAKIIEQSPRATSKGKLPSLGSSSVPFRVRDLKEKMEAAQRASRAADASQKGKEQNSVKHMRKQINARGHRQSEDSYLYKSSEESKRAGPRRLKSKEKSVSRAVQAKSNIQKRDGSSSVGNRSSEKQKEHNDFKPSYVSRNVPNIQKKVDKQGSSRRPSEALRQNHNKQNCASDENGEDFEPSCSYARERKDSHASTNYTYDRANRTVNKIVINNVVTSRKTNCVAADTGKEIPSSRVKTTTSKKKLLTVGNIQSGGNVSEKGVVLRKGEKSVKCNVAYESDSKWDEIDKKSSLDVVSFTFTSPIKKSGAGSSSGRRILEVTGSDPSAVESESVNSAASSSGFIGGDALSVLLEQKLKELTSRVELSQKDTSETGSFSNASHSYENTGCSVNSMKSLSVNNDTCKSKPDIQNASAYPADKEKMGLEFTETDGNNSIAFERYLHLQGSVSVPNQPSFSGASSDSFDVDRSSSYEGALPCLSVESYERTNRSSKGDAEISDTASSLSVGTISETTISSTSYITDSKDTSYWELHYISDILSHGELMLEEFALGQAHKIIVPDVFDQLENQKTAPKERFALEHKVLFDCVSECLEVRGERLLAGSYKFWATQKVMLNRKQWLAEELYRDISGWTNVEELMADELVDKDMSSKSGKWIDFEVEAFEEGVEIEKIILSSLVDELIDDFLF